MSRSVARRTGMSRAGVALCNARRHSGTRQIAVDRAGQRAGGSGVTLLVSRARAARMQS
jgi:hypothetical protein